MCSASFHLRFSNLSAAAEFGFNFRENLLFINHISRLFSSFFVWPDCSPPKKVAPENNVVFFNQVQYEEKSRESSGWHKGQTILLLHRAGLEIEYFFEHDADELVGFAVVEKTVIPFEMMEEVVVSNAKSGGAQNITINKREFRYVNNNKILYLEYTASIYDMPFNFHVYILSAKNTGTIQFAASTTLDLKNRYLNEIESFLNGIELY